MKARMLLPALLAVGVLALAAPAAQAHPLGNFSINHMSKVSISAERVDVRYVLDQAEIPTVQERGIPRAELLQRKLDEVERGLSLSVDGRPVELRRVGEPSLSFPPGAGGLKTTRLEVDLRAAVDSPRRVGLEDETFEDRVGWKAIVSAAGEDTAVRTQAPSGDPTNGLRRYPEDLLNSPLDRREASFSVAPGSGTLTAPRSEGAGEVSTSRTGGDGFAALFEQAAAGEGVLFILLLAAFGWGALHALSPGHGKAMVAAYLVGTRASRDMRWRSAPPSRSPTPSACSCSASSRSRCRSTSCPRTCTRGSTWSPVRSSWRSAPGCCAHGCAGRGPAAPRPKVASH